MKGLGIFIIAELSGFFTMLVLSFPLPPAPKRPIPLRQRNQDELQQRASDLLNITDSVLDIVDRSLYGLERNPPEDVNGFTDTLNTAWQQNETARGVYQQALTEWWLGRWADSTVHARHARSLAEKIYILLNPIQHPMP